MYSISSTLDINSKLLKSKISKQALYGVLISFFAIFFASAIISYINTGSVNLTSIIQAHKANVAMWFLDFTPVLFAFWGQYVKVMMAHNASTLILEQTHDLREKAEKLESKFNFEKRHDFLTKLPNGLSFYDCLDQLIKQSRSSKQNLCVMLINLEQLKEINRVIGPSGTDKVVNQVAARLKGVVSTEMMLSRFSHDEFSILIPNASNLDEMKKIAKSVQGAFNSTFHIDNKVISMECGIGLSLYPNHGYDADTLIQKATLASFFSRQQHLAFYLYDKKLDYHESNKLVLMGDLQLALEHNDLIFYYQPIVNLKNNKIESVEALVRWQHPRLGLLLPDEFIPLSERTNLIKKVTFWALNNAVKTIKSWHEKDINLNISINLSTYDILDYELPDILAGILAKHQVPSHWIKLELTENSILYDEERGIKVLHSLYNMGVKIAIDDFGKGYSSLTYLSKLPIHELKIDKAFIMNMIRNPQNKIIVKSIIDLAHNLGLRAVGEGVSEKDILEQLIHLGCDMGQGYYISIPKSEEELLAWVNEPNDFLLPTKEEREDFLISNRNISQTPDSNLEDKPAH